MTMEFQKLASWEREVKELRSFLDEKYTVTLPSRISVSYDTDYQYGWAKIGVDKFCQRCIPQLRGGDKSLDYLPPLFQAWIYDAVAFGNSTLIVTPDGKARVSTPETSYAWVDAFGTVTFNEDLGTIVLQSIDGVAMASGDKGKTWEPAEQVTFSLFYRADGAHPTGRSRVTNSIRKSIRSASRAKLRSEVASNYRTYPMIVFSGIWEDMASSVKKGISSIKRGLSNVVGLPRDPDTGQAIEVKEISAADFSPFLLLKDSYAKDVAAAFNVDASEFGVSVANQPSADAQYAGKEDLILEITSFETGILPILQEVAEYVALCLSVQEPVVSFAEPGTPSKGAQADAFVKLSGAIPQLKYSPAALQWAGLPNSIIEEITLEAASWEAQDAADEAADQGGSDEGV